ncbi:MAG: hypothetical protein FIA94_08015 [Nitrospirae bacterium]|nr:hypothetical protein [Nitrospirota bacterium]
MKRILLVVLVLALITASYLAFSVSGLSTTSVIASKKTYTATMYIAGMGGHFAKADITIDPNNADKPLTVSSLDRVVIGDKTTHPTHDARIDVKDPNTLFWSTYTLDPSKKMHVGKSDLRTGNVITDIALDPDKRAPGEKPPLYCASGQTINNYLPVFMGVEGYIDVFDKKTLKLKHRMFVSDIGYKEGSYVFVHGINSNDMKTFVISMNQKGDDGKANGKVDFLLVDLPSLEKGKWKVLKKNTLTGEPGKTITFRQFFSKDNKYIFESAGDRFWLIDAKSLRLVDEKMTEGQNHDAMPTPDGKYAVLTLRTNTEGCDAEGKAIPGKTITDGTLQVYDFEAKKIIGKPVSICVDCHKNVGLGDKSSVLCGIDGIWKK